MTTHQGRSARHRAFERFNATLGPYAPQSIALLYIVLLLFADAHASLAGILHAAGRSSEAVAQFEKALALEPNQPATHSNFGALLAALGRHAEATAHFERALVLAPGSAVAHNNFGRAPPR